MWTSPEILMELPWNTAADIWSFGAMVRQDSTRNISINGS
jgi:hypothetical protein